MRICICISARLSRRERRKAQAASSSFPQPLLHLPGLLAPADGGKSSFDGWWWSGRAEEELEREKAATAQGSTTAAGETEEAAGEDAGRGGRRRLHLRRGPCSESRSQLTSGEREEPPTLRRGRLLLPGADVGDRLKVDLGPRLTRKKKEAAGVGGGARIYGARESAGGRSASGNRGMRGRGGAGAWVGG
jgi:hypothetical protein